MTLPLLITNSIIMYIIGIKFGYKETAASFCNTDAVTGVVGLLHILDSQTPESCKVDVVTKKMETGSSLRTFVIMHCLILISIS